MNSRWLALLLVLFTVAFLIGFNSSYGDGIQPGYFEKAEAPAYGVSDGGEGLGVEMDEDIEKFFKDLYKDDEE